MHDSTVLRMSTGWTISDGEKIIDESADFRKTGWLKEENRVSLTHTLPETSGESLCFTTIGYTVIAFVDGRHIYSFGSSPDGNDVWGAKVHIIRIPDGSPGRMLRLEFSTNHPMNIAVSKHVILDSELSIIKKLVKVNIIDIFLSFFYISIGIFTLIYSVFSLVFRNKEHLLSVVMLALLALFMGCKILFNIAFVALFTGPEFICWSTSLLNFVIPIPAFIFAAADKGFEKSRLLIAVAAIQSAALVLWLLCKCLDLDIYLLYWRLPLSVLAAAVFTVTFVIEFINRKGRPEVAAAVLLILYGALLDAQIYFTHGSYYSIVYNLTICTLPVLVLLTGRTVLHSIRSKLRIMDENITLRVEGDLLFENYKMLDHYIEEAKKIWHDIDKHYSMIGRMTAEEEYDELKSYLHSMGHDMTAAKSTYLCDNRLTNAILTDKIAEAKNAGITVDFSGNLPESLQIQGNDLCSLLVNMLDNAIEACGRIPSVEEKKMDIAIGLKNNFVYFSVSNTTEEKPVREGGEFISSNEDKEKHGYGIPIMRKITEKYNGAFDADFSGNIFTVRAALKNTNRNS